MKEIIETIPPEEDERVHLILTKLTGGMDREALADELNYTTYKSLDMYMRRKGYRWCARSKTYIPNVEEVPVAIDTTKASRVIQLLNDNPQDVLLVCNKLRFQDLQELTEYMTVKGYTWNNAISNYERSNIVDHRPLEGVEFSPEEGRSRNTVGLLGSQETMEPYLSLLKMLKHNETRLTELLVPFGEGCTLPRYTIEGIRKTKTVQMVHSLANLVTEYADDKGIHQGEVVEIALIDFFRKYGYEKEVKTVLKVR